MAKGVEQKRDTIFSFQILNFKFRNLQRHHQQTSDWNSNALSEGVYEKNH